MTCCLFQFFPYPQVYPYIQDIKNWVEDNPYDLERRKDDHNKTSKIISFPILKRTKVELSPLLDPHNLLKESRIKSYYYSKAQDGYYIIYGKLGLPEAMYGAYIISAQGHLKHIIKRPNIDSKFNYLGQGGVTEYGTFIFNSYYDLWVSDACGNKLLGIKSKNNRSSLLTHKGFHHKASGDKDHIWVLYTNQLRQYSLYNGKMTRKVNLMDIVKLNKDLGIFEARFKTILAKNKIKRWKYKNIFKELTVESVTFFDPFHQNDVDVLTLEQEKYYPQFKAGDLLLSFRSLNLIVIIDPDSLKVKWYHFGGFSRQHDPDWSHHGTITVYDNQSHNIFSRIVSINLNVDDPVKKTRILFSGEDLNFYQFAEGNHHIDQQNRIFFSNQGEAVQVSQNGEIIFYFHHKDLTKGIAKISELRFIEKQVYNEWFASCLP